MWHLCDNFVKIIIMETNWTLISIVIVVAIVLIFFLVKRNLKDKEQVTKHFNDLYKGIDDESEPNDER